MQASLSALGSGTMAPSNTSSLAGVLDLAETLEAFAQRLRQLRTSKGRKLLEPFREVGQPPGEEENVVNKLLDGSLTKKQLHALTRRAQEVMR
jgi:hypothetical protein